MRGGLGGSCVHLRGTQGGAGGEETFCKQNFVEYLYFHVSSKFCIQDCLQSVPVAGATCASC